MDRKGFKISDLYSCILQSIKSDLKLGLPPLSVSQIGNRIARDMQAMQLDSDKRAGFPLSVFNAYPDPAAGLQHQPNNSGEDIIRNSGPTDGLQSLQARTSESRLARISSDMYAFRTDTGSFSFPVH